MRFKSNVEPVYSGDYWYDLTDGGYILPRKMLEDEKDIKAVEDAIALVVHFLSEAQEKELLIEN